MMTLSLGPQVAIVDDMEREIQSINSYLDDQQVGHVFFNSDPLKNTFPSSPLNSVELIFLDLYFAGQFIPEYCAEWVDRIIPQGNRYFLIIWSRDTDRADAVLEQLHIIGKVPAVTTILKKEDYRTGDNEYNVNAMALVWNKDILSHTSLQEIYGEIIEVEDDRIVVNCLISKDPASYQVRRFDKAIFETPIIPKKGMYILITITTQPYLRLFEFAEIRKDLGELFVKPDIFKGIENTHFFKGD